MVAESPRPRPLSARKLTRRDGDIDAEAPQPGHTPVPSSRVEQVFVAGIPVRDELILELARLVDDAELAERLEDRYRREVKVMALDIADRETILRALADPPAGLEELGAVLLQEVEWRRREGL
jgi:hypothetical protein